jgi:hypothetical protein
MSNINSETMNTNAEVLAKLVPNQSAMVIELVKEYHSLVKASGENILDLGKTIYVVETELNQRYREDFYHQVGLDPKSSTVRKLKAIGEKHMRFMPFLGRLPTSWTTLYALARMSDEEFQRIVEADVLSPFVSLKAIEAVIPKTSSKSGSGFLISVDLSKVTGFGMQRDFIRKLKELVDAYQLELATSPAHQHDLESLLVDEAAIDMKHAA